jgi:hypothetical protein
MIKLIPSATSALIEVVISWGAAKQTGIETEGDLFLDPHAVSARMSRVEHDVLLLRHDH